MTNDTTTTTMTISTKTAAAWVIIDRTHKARHAACLARAAWASAAARFAEQPLNLMACVTMQEAARTLQGADAALTEARLAARREAIARYGEDAVAACVEAHEG